jgi:hypothetical protein
MRVRKSDGKRCLLMRGAWDIVSTSRDAVREVFRFFLWPPGKLHDDLESSIPACVPAEK